MIGGVRKNSSDGDLVSGLKTTIKELNLDDSVQIIENAPFSTLLAYLCIAKVGLHAMNNEHFGISLIEYMVVNF